jgi:excisionase family DNA binding protein
MLVLGSSERGPSQVSAGSSRDCHRRVEHVRVGTSPTLITTAAASRRLKVVPLTVRRWIRCGRLRGQKVGRSWVVDEDAVAELESRGGKR